MAMRMLEITDGAESGCLAFDLADVIAVFGNEGLSRQWLIKSLEAVAKPASGLDVLALERQVHETEGGLPVEWQRLESIAKMLHQTINCKIVGSDGSAIEAQDTTRWILTCTEPVTVERFRQCFKRVREVSE